MVAKKAKMLFTPNSMMLTNVRIYLLGFTAALVGLLFGLGVGVISGAASLLQHDLNISDRLLELVIAAPLWGAVLGTFLTGIFSHMLGRKKTMLLSTVVFILGSLACSASNSVNELLLARIIFGIAIGMASFTAPVYISEIAPSKIRGSLMSIYMLVVAAGVIIAFLSNTFIIREEWYTAIAVAPWRLMLGVISLPALVTLLGIFFLPESPRWLFLKGCSDEAVAALKKIGFSQDEIAEETKAISMTLQKQGKGFLLFLTNAPFRRVMLLGICLQVIQQITGINIVLFYAPRIFQMAGFVSSSQQLWGTVLVGVINMLAALLSIFFIDKLGRKPMMALGLLIMGIALTGVGYLLKTDLHQHHLLAEIAVGLLLLFILGFGMSAGPIIWLLCSEIVPLSGKDLGVTFSTAANWISNAIVSGTFLTLLHHLGNANAFLFYAGLQVLSLLFLFIFVPETKGIPLEKIESNLFSGLPLRHIGQQ